MATEVITETAPSSPPAVGDSSKKRKQEIDEIEVDLALPEPPSKKAKRLLKKGKPLPPKPNSDDEAAESEDELPIPKTAGKGAKDKDGKSKRSEHGIWIGNLPFTLTRVELFKWLIDNSGGAIKEESITRVNLPTSKESSRQRRVPGEEAPPRQNRGFAYVDFDAEPAAVAAMALTEAELWGRKVLIKSSKSFEGRPTKEAARAAAISTGANGDPVTEKKGASAAAAAPPSRKIYVGNLSFQATEEDLREHFEKCGEIEWLKVATFEDSGKCKGFGWVKFKEPEAAGWAVKGFVKIREEIETEDDFRDKDEPAAEGEDSNSGEEKEEKKFKMRKWWVNRLRGRELKIELAEDDQTRYRKRYGKDAPPDRKKMLGKKGDSGGVRRGADGAIGNENGAEGAREKKKSGYGDAAVASYLTGAVVKPEGKKITFD
ncbi:RNA-binding domain-containing protein [Hypoxylon rubiginosum]|uniref:RNA-binding domain-containing protein n=1 Tax=Hypoxylon rubiginosum TaxID=110542 RepID=A0ACC0CW18_9PEZI|nr:RNA-binding domain-containing protein [Hypoxylon rubiginosum]